MKNDGHKITEQLNKVAFCLMNLLQSCIKSLSPKDVTFLATYHTKNKVFGALLCHIKLHNLRLKEAIGKIAS